MRGYAVVVVIPSVIGACEVLLEILYIALRSLNVGFSCANIPEMKLAAVLTLVLYASSTLKFSDFRLPIVIYSANRR